MVANKVASKKNLGRDIKISQFSFVLGLEFAPIANVNNRGGKAHRCALRLGVSSGMDRRRIAIGRKAGPIIGLLESAICDLVPIAVVHLAF